MGDGIKGEVNLSCLAFRQGEVEVGQSLLEEGRGGFVDDFNEGVIFQADVDFEEPAVLHRDPVDGQGIEIFVGENAAGDISEGEGVRDDGVGSCSVMAGAPIYGYVYEGVGEGGGEVGANSRMSAARRPVPAPSSTA